jgi:hypothetical protein
MVACAAFRFPSVIFVLKLIAAVPCID